MTIESEFATVALILGSDAETRGVDAFALSVIKAERQVRKLVTHLVYQFPAFGPGDVPELRAALGRSRRVYFEGFLAGFDALYPKPVSVLVGADFPRLRGRIDEAIDHRNKIFHGQLTDRSLSRSGLMDLTENIRVWCTHLGSSAEHEIGYDGFGRNSFQKSKRSNLWTRYRIALGSIADYKAFIETHMER